MTDYREFQVEAANAPSRLDVFLAARLPDLTRSFIQRLIHDGKASVNGKPRSKTGFSLTAGDRICLELPPPVTSEVTPEEIPLDILYEDAYLAVVNKSRGMVVHPAAGNYRGTLVNALLAHCSDLSGINGVIRPGIVHRLDKDTSGAMLVAKTDQAHVALAEQIKNHSAGRIYIAIVYGVFAQPAGVVTGPIGRDPRDRKKMAVVGQGGKPAVTHFQVLEQLGAYSLVKCRLETGRTHQIRVHLAHIGHPVVGDPKYGPALPKDSLIKKFIKGQALHSAEIHFRHPQSGELLSFTAPLPADMKLLLERLR